MAAQRRESNVPRGGPRTACGRVLLRVLPSVAVVVASGCSAHAAAPTAPPSEDAACKPRTSMLGLDVPRCLHEQGLLTDSAYRAADSVLRDAQRLGDSVRADTGMLNFYRAMEITRAIGHVADFYTAGKLPDSVRFDRLVDHVAVTTEYVRGRIRIVGTVYYPSRTPALGWVYYAGAGFYFQPVSSVQRVLPLLEQPSVSTDTLARLGDALWGYAVWHQAPGVRFPVWEYQFNWLASGAVPLSPPWQSAMAQGSVLALYTELYRRTGRAVWHERANAAFRSFQVSWDDFGVRLPDTTHGYWWEEYHPRVMVWNGSTKALLTLGQYARVMNSPEATRMFGRGVAALKYYTPRYDTGSWTLYSLTGGNNTRSYHAYHITLIDALYDMTGDPWAKATGDRWRSYTPPPGVQ